MYIHHSIPFSIPFSLPYSSPAIRDTRSVHVLLILPTHLFEVPLYCWRIYLENLWYNHVLCSNKYIWQGKLSVRCVFAQILFRNWIEYYRTRSNLWNVVIIGMPNFNYLICSNSWNKWIFEINNHSNRSNGQVLLSFIFSCYNVSWLYYLPMEHYVPWNLQSVWNEWRAPDVAFHIYFSSTSLIGRQQKLNSGRYCPLLFTVHWQYIAGID